MTELAADNRHGLLQDGLLAVLCVVGVTVAAVPLLRPASGRGEASSSGLAIATVASVTSGVRLRPAHTLVWNRVAPLDTTFESDVLFVPGGGAATLRFTDGTELRLDPHTLIVFESPTDRRPTIGLREGSVLGSSGDTGLEIQSASGDTISVAKSSRVHIVRSNEGTQVQVLEGQAKIGTAAGERTVGERELGGFDDTGALRPNERPPVTLLFPSPQDDVDIAQSRTVRLSWQVHEQAHTLQVASDRDFNRKVLDKRMPVGANEYELKVEQAGVFWWRFVDERGNLQSAVSSFHAHPVTSPVLIFPQMDQVVLAPPDRGLVFTWSIVEGCSAYLIEVARDARFSTVVLSEKVEGPQLWIGTGIDEGHYSWRVRADGCGNAPFSSAGRFRLISKPLLDAPTAMDAEVVDK